MMSSASGSSSIQSKAFNAPVSVMDSSSQSNPSSNSSISELPIAASAKRSSSNADSVSAADSIISSSMALAVISSNMGTISFDLFLLANAAANAEAAIVSLSLNCSFLSASSSCLFDFISASSASSIPTSSSLKLSSNKLSSSKSSSNKLSSSKLSAKLLSLSSSRKLSGSLASRVSTAVPCVIFIDSNSAKGSSISPSNASKVSFAASSATG